MKATGWVVAGGLLALVGVQELRLQRMRAGMRELEDRLTADAAPPRPGSDAFRSDAEAGHPAPPRRERPVSSPASEDSGEAAAGMGRTLRKMAENPVSRAMMNQGMKAMVAVWYADLVEEFGLSKEEADYFLGLKASMFAEQQRFGMELMSAKDPAGRQAILDAMNRAKDENKEAVRTFLNHDEDFAVYESFEDRLPERQQLGGLRTSMAGSGAPLREDQEAALVEAMYRARHDQPQATDWNGAEGLEALANGNARESFESEWEQSAARTATEVGSVLDASQMEAFRAYQQQLKEMQLMGLEMARKMFEPGPPDVNE